MPAPSPTPRNPAAQASLEGALPAALARIAATPGVYAALWCGSAARGEADAHSDLDIHALVTGDHRWRSSFVAGGVPVEVFHNPARKVRAMLAQPDHATVAMFAGGRVLLPHPDLDALFGEARALYAAGPAPRPLTPAERHTLLDEVVEARAALTEPVHPLLVASAAGRLVRALYAARGWWEVKPRVWPRDLARRGAPEAGLLHAVLSEASAAERQTALEALAFSLLPGGLDYGESASEAQTVA
ncbi:nucleotidyltransferase domain-containing protein [Deinococcus budaensis]|uniref:Nucleotidyltransferase domain-containing protein n=1 Tax=Deinococcus budaensis TaxID=1665626 RepID=A0A7W8LNU3_9DEIO|nr:nucleotidyltransferase domain-containing protein [Deinococcus budaensis]MBB5232880.1 hypothetical protein [Deinococcus budaensis]